MTTTTDPTLTGNTDPTLTDATSSSSTTTPVTLTAPVLALDQASADYSPGQTVGITASNVAVGGSVTFDVEHVLAGGMAVSDLTGTGTPWTVTDGGPGDLDGVANGVIQTSWYVNNDAFGQAFVLTAADQTTGQVATTNFTDAKLSQAPFAYSDQSASGIDMTTASAAAGNFVTLNNGVFGTDVPLGNVSGSGQFQPFVRIQTNLPQEEGYNSTAIDNATIQFHSTVYADDLNNSSNNPAFSPTLLLSNLGNVIIGGTPYYEFFLDANQANSKSLISLDSVQIFQSTNNALGTTSALKFDPQAIEGGTGTGFGSNATLVWDLDAGGDKSIMIDTNIAGSGSGRPDFALLLPQSLFNPANGNNIYFYSSFGGHTQAVASGAIDGTNTSGFEEWSAFTGTTNITPSLTITKTATIHDGGATVDNAGDVIDYVITVHNTGNINLTSVNVTDQLEAGFTGTPGTLTLVSGDTSDPGVLDVGETWVYNQSYTVSAADITSFGVDHDGFIDNTATVTTAQTPTPQSAMAQVPVFGANPGISILKTVTSVTDTNHDGLTDAGDVINYNIHVANTGNVTLTGLTVTDPLTGNPVSAGTLAVGGSEDLSASYTLTQADIDHHGSNAVDLTADNKITNTATANSNEAGPVSSSVDTPIDYKPGIDIHKTATIADGHADAAGDIINYTVLVTNTGDVTLSNVDVTDSFEGLSPVDLTNSNSFNPVTHTGNTFVDPNNNGTLDPGETWTYTYQHVVTATDLLDSDGKLDNTASVTTTTPDLGPLTDSASVPILLGPGVRTPGFWSQNTGQNQWVKFWDGIAGDEPKNQVGTDGFPKGELTYAVDSNHDNVINGLDSKGLLIGDFNKDGLIDNGEHDIFISLDDALTLLNASQKQQQDERYVLGRDLVATWLNVLNGNGAGQATDLNSPHHYIDDAVQWLDKTGAVANDHTLSVTNDLTSKTAVSASSPTWQQPQSPIDLSAAQLHSGLDEYNNHGTILGVSYAPTP